MIFSSNDFLKDLQHRLAGDLPGSNAHILMSPPYRQGSFEKIPSNPRLSAVSVVIHKHDSEWCFFLIKRPAYEGTHSNQIAFPGGKLEKGETFEQGARRETYEEIGLDINELKLIGKLSPLYINVSNFLVHPFVFHCEDTSRIVKDEREVDEVFRVPVKYLLKDSLRKSTHIKQGGLILKDIPYFDFHEEIVWGATACMLSELAEIIR